MIALDRSNIDLSGPTLQSFARDLQGNILRSHQRPHQRILMLQIDDRGEAAASLCAKVLPLVTTAAVQETLSDNALFVSLLVTRSGYSVMGVEAPVDLILLITHKTRREVDTAAHAIIGTLRGITLVSDEAGEPLKNSSNDDLG